MITKEKTAELVAKFGGSEKNSGKTVGLLARGACTCGGAAGGRKTGKERKSKNCAFSCDCAKRNFRIALFAKRGSVFLPFAAPTRVQAPRGTKGMALAKRNFTTFWFFMDFWS